MVAGDSPTLEDYADFLTALDRTGIGFAVIGGAAVGAYARLLGERVISADLDLVVSPEELNAFMASAGRLGATLEKRPQPRSIPVAFLRWRGLEVNALTSSEGLPAAETVIQTAREFHLAGASAPIPIADAFALLSNKLAVNREKDRPHIDILKRFLISESVAHFGRTELPSRRRIATIKRYLQMNGLKTVANELFVRLQGASPDAVGRRFLVSHSETPAEAQAVVDSVTDQAERADLQQLLDRRFAE